MIKLPEARAREQELSAPGATNPQFADFADLLFHLELLFGPAGRARCARVSRARLVQPQGDAYEVGREARQVGERVR